MPDEDVSTKTSDGDSEERDVKAMFIERMRNARLLSIQIRNVTMNRTNRNSFKRG